MPLNLQHIEERLQNPETKHLFEYQSVCEELQPIYGKRIWTLPHQAGVTEYKIAKAHEIAVKRGRQGDFRYLRGIIKRLP